MRKIAFALTLFLSLNSFAETAANCGPALAAESTAGAEAREVAQAAVHQAEVQLENKGVALAKRRGYALLIGSMVGSAVLTTYLGAHLDRNFQFLSIFVAQLSTLGVYTLGAPIWEPLGSRFRQFAFGIKRSSRSPSPLQDARLESTWLRTQENYSLNAQMSRNVVSQFILSTRQNFADAYRAHVEAKPEYAADQIAEAAFRFRILFRDIEADNVSVTAAIRSAFTNHVKIDAAFARAVWARLAALDPEFNLAENERHYASTLQAWLGGAGE